MKVKELGGLFDKPANPKHLARRDSPITSIVSAELAADNHEERARQIGEVLKEVHPRGLLCEEIAEILTERLRKTVRSNWVSSRRVKMEADGLMHWKVVDFDLDKGKVIYESRMSKANRPSNVWFLGPNPDKK